MVKKMVENNLLKEYDKLLFEFEEDLKKLFKNSHEIANVRLEIDKALEEHKAFNVFLDEHFVLEIEDFQIWIPTSREGQLKEICKVLQKERI